MIAGAQVAGEKVTRHSERWSAGPDKNGQTRPRTKAITEREGRGDSPEELGEDKSRIQPAVARAKGEGQSK